MAVSVALVDQFVAGNKRVVTADVTMDSSYLSGGEPLTLAQLGLTDHTASVVTMKSPGSTTVNVTQGYYDGALLHLFDETPAEVASTSDLTGVVMRLRVEGR